MRSNTQKSKVPCVNQRGFVVTIDAFLSVTLLVLLVLLAFFYLSQVSLSSWKTVQLKQIAVDELTVLAKNQLLTQAVRESSAESLLGVLNATPTNYCFEVSILNSATLVPLVHTMKTGCVKYTNGLVVVERVVVVREATSVSLYLARIEGWVKG